MGKGTKLSWSRESSRWIWNSIGIYLQENAFGASLKGGGSRFSILPGLKGTLLRLLEAAAFALLHGNLRAAAARSAQCTRPASVTGVSRVFWWGGGGGGERLIQARRVERGRGLRLRANEEAELVLSYSNLSSSPPSVGVFFWRGGRVRWFVNLRGSRSPGSQ